MTYPLHQPPGCWKQAVTSGMSQSLLLVNEMNPKCNHVLEPGWPHCLTACVLPSPCCWPSLRHHWTWPEEQAMPSSVSSVRFGWGLPFLGGNLSCWDIGLMAREWSSLLFFNSFISLIVLEYTAHERWSSGHLNLVGIQCHREKAS